jgi:O-antigen/teichoic acid export membrane protein
MGQIRKQTILSSIVIYTGFLVGFLNTYLYVKNGTFTTEQYGLTRLITDLGITFCSFAALGVTSYIYKFYPYYKQNLPDKENDQAAISLVIVTVGFILVALAAYYFKPLFIRKFSERSKLFIDYYYWILPFTFGILYFSMLETFAWFVQKSILTNFLKEAGLRVLQLALILLYLFKAINFDAFIKLFSCLYIILFLVLIFNLYNSGNIHFNFKISVVTSKFFKKIALFVSFIYASLVINTVAQYIDAIVIASVSKGGLADVGVYTLAAFIATTIIVPQRSIISATVPVLSASWRSKNLTEISRIYSRTSINLLLIALFIFFMIWLNIQDLFKVLNINKDFEAGRTVILLLGIKAIVDAGTGVNAQIIATSNFWRFEVLTGILLFSLCIPLNYILVKKMGINGSALSDLIAYSIYNAVRLFFIWKKFKLQPFTSKTLISIILVMIIYYLCYYLLRDYHNWTGIIIRSVLFTALFTVAAFVFKLTPDLMQLFDLVKSKLQKKENRAI